MVRMLPDSSEKANSLSGKSNSASHSQNHTDTMIGVGVRVEGNIVFRGVLRVQGDVHGDVSCDDDGKGTVVVDSSGKLTGAIKAPHIVVSGDVQGSVHSSQTLEIRQGACIAGDALYRDIDIHAGGVIEGMLTPAASMARDGSRQQHRARGLEPPTIKPYGQPFGNGSRFAERFGGWRGLAGALVLGIGVVAVVWLNQDRAVIAQPVADVAFEADSTAEPSAAAQAAPVAGVGLREGPRAVAEDAVSSVPGSATDTRDVVQGRPADRPKVDSEKVATVQGVNPGKPAGVFLLISKEPSVLFKKQREDPGDGTRMDVAQGASLSIAVARNEIFRVAKGRGIEIFYQGRKVSPKTIESGAWMSFAPQPPGQ